MKKKIIISAVSVGLALAVIGASVGTYMSYINKYEPIASPTALAYTKSDRQKALVKNADFYVSVNGDDNGDGTLEKPFQTIKRAQQAVREAIANSEENKASLTVAIMAGTYYETGIAFDERDSSKSTSVTYTSYGDGEVILCGGKILTPADFSSVNGETAKRLSSQAADKVKMLDLKKYGLTKSDYGKIKATGGFNTEEYYDNAATENPCELFFNDKRMTIARYPNDSYITVGKVSDIGDCYEPNAPAPVIGNVVSHNEIYNAPHMGVYYTGNENVVEYNYIHDVVLQSSDAGAIYTGYSYSTYGNVVRYNCISNIGSGTFTPSGIYFDDNSSGQTAYGNVLINIPGYAFLVGGGRDNMIENNLVINAGKQILYDDRAYDGYHNDGWYAKNCKTPDSRLWQLMNEAKEFNASIGNKYDGIERMHQDYEREEDEGFAVNPSGSSVQNNIIISKQNKVGEIAKTVKKYSVVENNQTFTLNGAKSSFEDYENGDYRIKADSKISKECSDFKEIPFNEIGRK